MIVNLHLLLIHLLNMTHKDNVQDKEEDHHMTQDLI